ncbi:MAG: hypothetical protein B0A82_10595 [Alkalinema sp. CACIAM 70d]|nr:MAG: hypothetical protein B0A82_10595 [Alkalinema sp. CACIAM 70d]
MRNPLTLGCFYCYAELKEGSRMVEKFILATILTIALYWLMKLPAMPVHKAGAVTLFPHNAALPTLVPAV